MASAALCENAVVPERGSYSVSPSTSAVIAGSPPAKAVEDHLSCRYVYATPESVDVELHFALLAIVATSVLSADCVSVPR
jgi:hypothetical protein